MTSDNVDTLRAAAKLKAAERDAAKLGAIGERSMLPDDAGLTPDAIAIRAAMLTPLERLTLHAAGQSVYDGDMSRMTADKAALPFMHRTPAARTELSIDGKAQAHGVAHVWLDMLRAGTMTVEELAAMPTACTPSVTH